MKPGLQKLIVDSPTPPVVEFDPEAMAAYVRFRKGKVARTIECPADKMHVAVDLNAKGEVLGIEAIGMTELIIEQLLKVAKVETPRIDYSAARFVATPQLAAV